MKKLIKIMLLIALIFITACGKKEPVEPEEHQDKPSSEKAYYETLPMPSEKIDKITKNARTEEYVEYILYVKDFPYNKFYDYIRKLEKLGFNYEFVDEVVPVDNEKLNDKTETSWAASNGSIWIRAQWRSEDNKYFTGYGLQLIFDNYDYLKPVENVENTETTEKKEA